MEKNGIALFLIKVTKSASPRWLDIFRLFEKQIFFGKYFNLFCYFDFFKITRTLQIMCIRENKTL